ncbi:MAG: hypothetical protein KIS94_15960 [Chitinophagales bacterium]|nr:hypothetical protein [Chitinophagales bacterium]
MSNRLFSDKKLNSIYESVWTEPEQALAMLQKLPAEYKAKTLTPKSANAQLLQFMLQTMLQQFEKFDFEAKKLVACFKANEKETKIAMLEAWRMYAYIVIGNLHQANIIRQEFEKKFSLDNCAEAFVHYYVFSCFYADKNGYFEDYIRLAHETEKLLPTTALNESESQSLFVIAQLFKSRAYSNYHRFNEAQEILNNAKKIIHTHRLSVFTEAQFLINQTFYYDISRNRESAIATMMQAADVLEKSGQYPVSCYTAFANLLHLYNLKNSAIADKKEKEFIANVQQQKKYLAKAEKLVNANFTTASSGYFFYAKAWFLIQENKPEQALRAVANSVRIFYRLNQYRFLAQAYTAAYHIYKQQAVAEQSYRCAFKAARTSERMRTMTDMYYKQILKHRIESLELQFQLKEKELNEKILQQKIEAMNKEIQLTALNLHEKITVLDELKTYVHSLKKKELETRQLINTIAKKIDSVKITEQDKAVLQQKMDEGKQQLTKVLAAKFPSLSNMEIRMCTLFQTGMTNKELAKLYGQTEKAYEQHRYRIKKKIGLGAKENLVKYLLSVSGNV